MSKRDYSKYIWRTSAGQIFRRPKEFYETNGEPNLIGIKWLMGGDYADYAKRHLGFECIEIAEIVVPKKFGKIVIYHRWLIDPDGNEYTTPWAPTWAPKRTKKHYMAESNLRGKLNGGGYELVPQHDENTPDKNVRAKLKVVA